MPLLRNSWAILSKETWIFPKPSRVCWAAEASGIPSPVYSGSLCRCRQRVNTLGCASETNRRISWKILSLGFHSYLSHINQAKPNLTWQWTRVGATCPQREWKYAVCQQAIVMRGKPEPLIPLPTRLRVEPLLGRIRLKRNTRIHNNETAWSQTAYTWVLLRISYSPYSFPFHKFI